MTFREKAIEVVTNPWIVDRPVLEFVLGTLGSIPRLSKEISNKGITEALKSTMLKALIEMIYSSDWEKLYNQWLEFEACDGDSKLEDMLFKMKPKAEA